jgi:hypothetical protein
MSLGHILRVYFWAHVEVHYQFAMAHPLENTGLKLQC